MESYFTDLLESYKLLNQRKFKLTISESNEEIDLEVERLQKNIASIPSWATTKNPTVGPLNPYKNEGTDFPIYVQTKTGERPTVLTSTSGQVYIEKWRWLAKLRVGKTTDQEPEKESKPEEAQVLPPEINTPMGGGLPEDQVLDQNTFYNLQQIGNKLEKLRLDNFFETIPDVDWLNVPGNLLNKRILSPTPISLWGKLNGEVNYGISELGYERRILDPQTRNAFSENLFKAVSLIEESVRKNNYKEGDLQEIAKTLVADANGLWIKGKGLPDYGIGVGGGHRKKEELLKDPFVNLVISFNKRVRNWKREKSIIDYEQDIVHVRESVRTTSKEKRGETDLIWTTYLGKSFELYPLVVNAVSRGDKTFALNVLSKIALDIGLRIDKFNEYTAKIGASEVLGSEDSVEADKLSTFLYNDLLKVEKSSDFLVLNAAKQTLISNLNHLFGKSAARSFANRQPDAVLHVGNITEKGQKADIIEVYKESNKVRALNAAKVFGLKEADVRTFKAGDLQSNYGNLMEQGIPAEETVLAVPVNLKITWSTRYSNTILGGLLAKDILNFAPTTFSNNNISFVTEKQPQPLQNYFEAINKQLTHLDDLFNEVVVGRRELDPIEQTLKIVSQLLGQDNFQSILVKNDIDNVIKKVKAETYPTLDKIKIAIQNKIFRGVILRDYKDPNKRKLAKQALSMIILEVGNSINPVGLEIRNVKNGKVYRFNQNTLNEEIVKGIISEKYEVKKLGGQSIGIFNRVNGKIIDLFKIYFSRTRDIKTNKLGFHISTQVTESMKELMHEVSHNVMKGIHEHNEIEEYLKITKSLLTSLFSKSYKI